MLILHSLYSMNTPILHLLQRKGTTDAQNTGKCKINILKNRHMHKFDSIQKGRVWKSYYI